MNWLMRHDLGERVGIQRSLSACPVANMLRDTRGIEVEVTSSMFFTGLGEDDWKRIEGPLSLFIEQMDEPNHPRLGRPFIPGGVTAVEAFDLLCYCMMAGES